MTNDVLDDPKVIHGTCDNEAWNHDPHYWGDDKRFHCSGDVGCPVEDRTCCTTRTDQPHGEHPKPEPGCLAAQLRERPEDLGRHGDPAGGSEPGVVPEHPKYQEMRRLLDYLARAHPEWGEEAIALRIAQICCPGRLQRKYRR
jgi:hypothetical protein